MVLLLSFGCGDDDGPVQTRFTGPEVALGNGKAYSVVLTDQIGTPLALGVEFTPQALVGLPTGSPFPPEFMLSLPNGVEVPPFDHLTLDWNEHGHEPMHVYDKPHFDFHFYFMPESEIERIGPNDTVGFNQPLPPQNLPPNYLETPGGVPQMGAHVVDLQSPEIAGTGPFTYTFIYGKYAGRITFLEPMVTTEYFLTHPDLKVPIRQPAEWQEAGYYPASLHLAFNERTGLYSVMLEDLAWTDKD